ncbi:ribosomal protein L34Ae [Syncephalis fuscata]|nr:ribosomal protein L34Ae [Syncephalis fuscata]
MVQRLVYRRHNGYNTKSNRVKIVKTPGGRLAGSVPKCGDCGTKLLGLPALRPIDLSRISKRQKTVNRAYGGSRCAKCVRNRIVRAFLIEEQKIVKKMIRAQQA